MNKSEIWTLFEEVVNYFSAFSGDDSKMETWHDVLKDVSLEHALANLKSYAMTGKEFAPQPGMLAKPVKDRISLHHDGMRDSAAAHIAQIDQWSQTATAPPAHVKEQIERLRRGE